MTHNYKNFTLYHCYCGFPRKAWVIFWGDTYNGVGMTLKEAKDIVNGIIAEDEQWYKEQARISV